MTVDLVMIKKIKKLLNKEPRLKARDIAKKLNYDRTEVNSLLHKNSDFFIKNEEFEWSCLALNKEAIIQFENKWIDCSSFEFSLKNSLQDIDSITSAVFILPENSKFLLETIARFLAICNQLIDKKKKVTIDLKDNKGSLRYLNRAGFFDHLNTKVKILPKRPKKSTAESHKGNSKNLVEFGAVEPEEENRELVNQLTKAFIALSSNKYEDAAFTIFAELIGNIKEHSESRINGFSALQKYDGYSGKKPHIQTIVSDSGLGIVATLAPSLEKHYPQLHKLSDIDLVKAVMSKGEVSKHGAQSGHGLGFKSSKEKALKFNARYSVRQVDFSLDFQFENGKLKPVKELNGLVKIEGTHICFDFFID